MKVCQPIKKESVHSKVMTAMRGRVEEVGMGRVGEKWVLSFHVRFQSVISCAARKCFKYLVTLRKEGNAASLRYTELYGVIDGENESPLVMLQCGVSCLQDAIVSGKGPIMLTADNFERVAGK